MSRLQEGDAAPDFSLMDQSGHAVSLADLAGQRTLVYFYPQDDTPGCTAQACGFNDELAALNAMRVRVVGISPDSSESHTAFREKYHLGFTLLSDPERVVMEAYGAYGEKMMYGKRVTGVIRSTFLISPTGIVEKAFYNVRATGHVARIMKELAD
ncbi:MAG: thioredoxin-dependent thiol peroxidase [Acidimicrobiaceae bacterium]|nr:thioredoxin-dependent thiol peroxidase [Acidimicrobiaceae bacterium]